MAANESLPNYSLRSKAPFDLTDSTSTYLLDLASYSTKQVNDCSRSGENIIAASASNHTIKLYSRDTLQFQKQLLGHEHRISALQFSSVNPHILWSASQDATVRCWDIRMDQGSCQVHMVNSKSNIPFHSMGINASNTVMVAGTAVDNEDAHIILWDLRSYQELARFSEAHSEDITQVKFNTSDPCCFSTSSMDGLVCIFDTRHLSEDDSLTSVLNAEASVAKVDILNKLKDYGVVMNDMNVNNVAFTLGSSENFCRDPTKSHLYIGNCTTLCLHRVMKSWDSGDFGMHFVFSLNAFEHYLLGYRSWNHGLQLLTVDLAKIGFFGPSEEFVYALTYSETFSLWHAKEGSQHSQLLNIRETIKETYQIQVDYFVDCSFHSQSGRLFVLGGDNQGNLFILNAGVSGFAPLTALTRGHSSVIRCVDWDHQRGSLLSGGEDGFLCHWQQEDIVVEDKPCGEMRKISSLAEAKIKRKASSMPY